MTDITIPPEALEAMFKVLYPYMDTGGSEKMAREVCEDAFLAMVKAWPELQTGSDDGGMTLSGIYLPLTEQNDDKA